MTNSLESLEEYDNGEQDKKTITTTISTTTITEEISQSQILMTPLQSSKDCSLDIQQQQKDNQQRFVSQMLVVVTLCQVSPIGYRIATIRLTRNGMIIQCFAWMAAVGIGIARSLLLSATS
jgi:hypothetical protein